MANPFDPVAHDDTLAAVEDTPIIFTKAQLLGNDNHAPLGGGSLSIFSVTNVAGGIAVLNPDGSVTFTPAANFNGAATFSYIAAESGRHSNSATVTVNVAAVD